MSSSRLRTSLSGLPSPRRTVWRNPLRDVRHRLELNRDQLALGPAAVLHAVMDSVVDNYVLIERELSDDLERIEQQVFTGAEEADVTAIYRLKREVLEFRRAAYPLADALQRVGLRPIPDLIDTDVLPFFRDVADHLARVNDHIESYDRLLTDILNAHLTQVTVQQNEDVRRISAWVAIMAVPTMIAGIYGMNFEFIPELSATVTIGDSEFYWGYFAILAVILASTATLFLFFRRHRWL